MIKILLKPRVGGRHCEPTCENASPTALQHPKQALNEINNIIIYTKRESIQILKNIGEDSPKILVETP